jgi:formylglycine-generating enzyme required for sulfatase activity
LYDVHGDVREWCQDWYDVGYYTALPADDPTGPSSGVCRVRRGGSMHAGAGTSRSALRDSGKPGESQPTLGFRVALVLADKPNVQATPPATATTPSVVPPSSTAVSKSTGAKTASSAQPSSVTGAVGNLKLSAGAPPLAIAPFDEKKAQQHQAAWAKHLGLPVETTNSIGMKLVLIPPGEFLMGSPNSENQFGSFSTPRHEVRITRPFYLGKYLVTQEEWEAVMGSNPSSRFRGPTNPVETISWDDCQQFLAKLNAKIGTQGGKFVLPTEAQWEYACRAGSTTRYGFGDDESALGEYAWYKDNSDMKPHRVGEKRPNAWGLYDMHGNVEEACQDWYDGGYYASSLTFDPPGPATGSERVFRGGSFWGGEGNCRSATRHHSEPAKTGPSRGLRVCLLLAEPAAKPPIGKSQ